MAVRKTAKRPAKRADKASLADKLAESAWTQADAAFAEALINLDELESAASESARAEALALLTQSMARAARRRGLTRLGALGAREAFDADRHDAGGVSKTPKMVVITARGVARGEDVLLRPRAAPVRRKSPP